MKVPNENFTVNDVKTCVGSKRIIDIVDVNTQEALTMTMKVRINSLA
jgi:F-box and leucine-rich repeat protein 10/11